MMDFEKFFQMSIFFNDDEQPTEHEYFETKIEAEKRKEFILENKDKWFSVDEIDQILISDEPHEMKYFYAFSSM